MLEAEIKIKFKKIANQDVKPEMVNFALKHATKKTIKKLCQELQRYFHEKNIEVETEFKLIT